MSDPRAWSESRLERQSSMSPEGIESRLKEEDADARRATPRSRAPRRRGWVGFALGGVACIGLAVATLVALRRLLHA